MKRAMWFLVVLLSVFAAVSFGPFPSYAEVGNLVVMALDEDEGFPASSPTPALPVGHAPRYRVTYMSSQTIFANRTSTVVSITNNSPAWCSTAVDWRLGFGGTVCTTRLTLGPGQTGEHCSRLLPSAVSTCNVTCAPAVTAEGSAIVGSQSNIAACSAIAVSARTYHTTAGDAAVAAITDANIVKIFSGNTGD
jgi:hypothetical protein